MEFLKQYGRSFGSIFLGFIAAVVVIAFVHGINHKVYPPKDPVLLKMAMDGNATAMAQVVQQSPNGGKFFVVLAYALASFAGGWVAARMAQHQPTGHALVVGGCLMMAGISNFMKIPHPAWMIAGSMAAYLPCAWLGARLRLRSMEPEVADLDAES